MLVPWMPPGQKQPVAVVNLDNCNGCSRCAADCPFNAITMLPRSDGSAYEQEAVVDTEPVDLNATQEPQTVGVPPAPDSAPEPQAEEEAEVEVGFEMEDDTEVYTPDEEPVAEDEVPPAEAAVA